MRSKAVQRQGSARHRRLGQAAVRRRRGLVDLGGNPYDLVDVSGKVTYEDGSLIPAGSIMLKFDPEAAQFDAKTHPRKGFALVNVGDGTFDYATTHKHADGLVAGKHKVLVVAYAEDGKAASVVPRSISGLTRRRLKSIRSILPLEIKIKKPADGA